MCEDKNVHGHNGVAARQGRLSHHLSVRLSLTPEVPFRDVIKESTRADGETAVPRPHSARMSPRPRQWLDGSGVVAQGVSIPSDVTSHSLTLRSRKRQERDRLDVLPTCT